MIDFFNGIMTLVKYSVEGGFWHFSACLLIILAITHWSFIKITKTVKIADKEEAE